MPLEELKADINVIANENNATAKARWHSLVRREGEKVGLLPVLSQSISSYKMNPQENPSCDLRYCATTLWQARGKAPAYYPNSGPSVGLRLHANACALMAAAEAACLVSGPWESLLQALADLSLYLKESHSTALSSGGRQEDIRQLVPKPDTTHWTWKDVLDDACNRLATYGLPMEGARLWSRFMYEDKDDLQYMKVPVAFVFGAKGELGDLCFYRIAGKAEEYVEHPLYCLRRLEDDLLGSIRQAWGRCGAEGQRPALAWKLVLRVGGLNNEALSGPSLGAAAHAGCRQAARSDGFYDSRCLITAAVRDDGETLSKVDQLYKLDKVLESHREEKIERVVLAYQEKDGLLQEFLKKLEDRGIAVQFKKTVKEAQDFTSGIATGLNKYYEALIQWPDVESEKFVYLGGKKLTRLNVPMDVFQLQPRKQEEMGGGAEQIHYKPVRVKWESGVRQKMLPGAIVAVTQRAGYGKTQLARMTLQALAKEGQALLRAGRPLEELPLPVPSTCANLANLTRNLAKVFEPYVKAKAPEENTVVLEPYFAKEVLEPYFAKRIREAQEGNEEARKQLWIVLDAMDRVPGDSQENSQEHFEAALRTVIRWKGRVIITSRPEAYDDKAARFGWHPTVKHELAPLDKAQVEQFLDHWFTGNPTGEKIRNLLRSNASAEKMSEVPFLLTLMSWASDKESDNEPGLGHDLTRAGLYDIIVRRMLKTDRDSVVTPLRDVQLLPTVAGALFLLFRQFIEEAPGRVPDRFRADDVRHALSQAKRDFDLELSTTVDELMAELSSKRLLLGEDWLELPHFSLAEYLAGHHLARYFQSEFGSLLWQTAQKNLSSENRRIRVGERLLDYQEALPGLNKTGWEEAVLMGAGLTGVPNSYIQKVFSHDPVLAARCTEEISGGIRRGLQDAFRKSLRAIVEDYDATDVRTRIAAGNALALRRIGDPRWDEHEGRCGSYLLSRWVTIEGGTYTIGDNKSAYDDEKPEHPVPIGQFLIGVYPVTNAEYARFIQAGGYEKKKPWWNGLDAPEATLPEYWEDSRFTGGNKPVVGVSWIEAMAYCRWLSDTSRRQFRLPSEVEYEAAARGEQARRYSYGDDFDPLRANTSASGIRQTTPVGTYRGTPEGGCDFTGNVWCWTLSIYDRKRFPYPYTRRRKERENLEDMTAVRVLRGGSWGHDHDLARAASRVNDRPHDRGYGVGFRLVCVSSPFSKGV